MEKKYLVTWFDNAWHNGTFYDRNVRDELHQCININIKPKINYWGNKYGVKK